MAVIGAGWIGCEVAAAARHHGAEVTLLESASQPLEGVLGAELGEFFAGVHREKGVNLITGAKVESIEGSGSVQAVRLGGGERIECGIVVMGVGVAPRSALAEQAGLEVEDGVVVDEHLAASAPDVFAAGDVASSFRPRYGRHVRVEHWANALEQGPAAARSMLGGTDPFDEAPYFFSDQYDVGMEYVGLHSPEDRVVITRQAGGAGAAGALARWRRARHRRHARQRLGRDRADQGARRDGGRPGGSLARLEAGDDPCEHELVVLVAAVGAEVPAASSVSGKCSAGSCASASPTESSRAVVNEAQP